LLVQTVSAISGGKKSGYLFFRLGKLFTGVSKKALSNRSTFISRGISSIFCSICDFLLHEEIAVANKKMIMFFFHM
jgi:hypothetical protein